MQGLRVPGSYIDQNNPSAALGDLYFRGSGTSEAAAYVTGAVALLLQKYPQLTPDQVKQMLTASAMTAERAPRRFIAGKRRARPEPAAARRAGPPRGAGPGGPGGPGASSVVERHRLARAVARQRRTSRMNGVVLQGEQDIFGHPFNSAAMAALEAAGRAGRAASGTARPGRAAPGAAARGAARAGRAARGAVAPGAARAGAARLVGQFVERLELERGARGADSSWSGSSLVGRRHWLGASWG